MIEVAPEALEEIAEAAAWYDERRPGLGAEMLAEVDRGTKAIDERPRTFPRLSDVPADLVIRRALIKRFPFALVFLELGNGVVRVIAFAHGKRRPDYWLERVL